MPIMEPLPLPQPPSALWMPPALPRDASQTRPDRARDAGEDDAGDAPTAVAAMPPRWPRVFPGLYR